MEVNSLYESSNELKSCLQKNLEAKFQSYQADGILIMKASHVLAIVEYVVTLTETFGKAFSKSIIREGFIQNGMIGRAMKHSPDFYQITTGMVRHPVLQKELDNIIKHFPKLLKYQLDHGIILDSVMEAAGIPPGTDRDSKIV